MNLETSYSRTTYLGNRFEDNDFTRIYTPKEEEEETVISIIEEEDSDNEPEIEKECPFCQILYENSEYLKEHLAETHENIQNQGSNNSKNQLKIAIQKRILNKELSQKSYFADTYYTCDKCDEKFLCRDDYKAHLQTHPREKLHKCPICPNTFLYLNKLRYHLLHHNKLICNVCCKTFYSKKTLEAHTKQHLLFNHKCYLCTATFHTKKKLQVHIRKTHSHPFNCVKCGLGFKTQRKYKTHIKYPDCPNKCKVCQRSHTQRNALRMHMKRVHKMTLEEE